MKFFKKEIYYMLTYFSIIYKIKTEKIYIFVVKMHKIQTRKKLVGGKRRNMKKMERGITLVALVITIILLIILAGIGISLTLGERGIFQVAQQAEEEHKKAQLKEELELEIINLEAEKMGNITFADIANRLKEKGIGVTIEEEDGVQGEYKDYEFIVEKNKSVIIGKKLEGKRPEVLLIGSTMDSTNGKIKIQIIAREEIQTIEPIREGTLVSENGNNNKIFEVSEKGTYKFKIVGINGRVTVAKVEVNDEEIEEGESLLDGISKVSSSVTKKIKIEDNAKEYAVNTIYYDGNIVLDGKTPMVGALLSNNTYEFGSSIDVATQNQEAKNTVVLKVKGDITINSGVGVTACKSSSGYGGPKGLIIYCTGTFTNNGSVSMTARGAKATGEDIYLWKNQDGSFEYVPAQGAGGGGSVTVTSGAGWRCKNGNNGGSGSARQTGGGGSGGTEVKLSNNAGATSGRGGIGTSYSGGSGGGIASKWGVGSTIKTYNGSAGSDIGGPAGKRTDGNEPTTMGAGNPSGGTGGLLVIKAMTVKNMGILSSCGVSAHAPWDNKSTSGGGSGGGSINVFYENCENFIPSSIIVTGGARIGTYPGGAGGNGSITVGTVADGTFKCEYKNY